jgi:hypothetical protein
MIMNISKQIQVDAASPFASIEAVCNAKVDAVYEYKIYAGYISDVQQGAVPEDEGYVEYRKDFLESRAGMVADIKKRITTDLLMLAHEHLDGEIRRLAQELSDRLYPMVNGGRCFTGLSFLIGAAPSSGERHTLESGGNVDVLARFSDNARKPKRKIRTTSGARRA